MKKILKIQKTQTILVKISSKCLRKNSPRGTCGRHRFSRRFPRYTWARSYSVRTACFQFILHTEYINYPLHLRDCRRLRTCVSFHRRFPRKAGKLSITITISYEQSLSEEHLGVRLCFFSIVGILGEYDCITTNIDLSYFPFYE